MTSATETTTSKPCKYGHKDRNRSGACRPCARHYGRAWRARHPEQSRAATARYQAKNPGAGRASPEYLKRWRAENKRKCKGYKRQSLYGVTPARLAEMLRDQGAGCAICRIDITAKPCVDHDHTTGKVRGLLCRKCNSGLGMFQDSPEFLARATEYLQR